MVPGGFEPHGHPMVIPAKALRIPRWARDHWHSAAPSGTRGHHTWHGFERRLQQLHGMASKRLILEWKLAKMMQPILSKVCDSCTKCCKFPCCAAPKQHRAHPTQAARTSCQRHGGQQLPPPTPPQDPVRSNFSEHQPGNKMITQVREVP